MLLAAGVGSRLEPLTTQVPKPLVPIANVPVMEHMMRLLKAHGITEVYANLHYLPHKITEYFGDAEKLGMKLTCRYEEQLSGDAGGVRSMKEHLIDGTFIVVMGDLLTDADLTSIIREHKDKKALASIALKRVDDVTRFGIVVQNQDGFITGFQEKPAVEDALSDLASTGIYILEPEVFSHIPETGEFGFGRQLFPQLVAKGLPVLGIEMAKGTYWSDVGAIPQYLEANFDAIEGTVKLETEEFVSESISGAQHGGKPASDRLLGAGTTVHETAKIDAILMTGKNCEIAANAKLSGRVILGDNCIVEEGASLTDCLVWADSKIGRNSELNNTVVAGNTTVEPNSRHDRAALVPQKAEPKKLASNGVK
jgi:NDP-sugar pyrophosphorylase family protein